MKHKLGSSELQKALTTAGEGPQTVNERQTHATKASGPEKTLHCNRAKAYTRCVAHSTFAYRALHAHTHHDYPGSNRGTTAKTFNPQEVANTAWAFATVNSRINSYMKRTLYVASHSVAYECCAAQHRSLKHQH